MTSRSQNTEMPRPAVEFSLTGFSVFVNAESVLIKRTITTESAGSTRWSVPFSDFASIFPAEPVDSADDIIAGLRERGLFANPTPFTAGVLRLQDVLPRTPNLRVLPSALSVVAALVQFLATANKISGNASDFDRIARSWVDEHDVDGVSFADSQCLQAEPLPDTPAESVHSTNRPSTVIERFVAFDVETANQDWGSVIQLGLAVVENGEIIQTYSWPCRPPKGLEEFEEDNIAIHGIKPADVAGAPSFADRLQQLANVVGDSPIVAHNAKFDFTALKRACKADGVEAPTLRFACTYRWARQAQLGLRNLKLPTLADAAGYKLENHHDAAADAIACANVALWLFHLRGVSSVAALNRCLSMTMGQLSGTRLSMMRWDPSAEAAASGDADPTASTSGNGAGTNNMAKGRRQAKWDAAKTPDKIPEPNLNADPAGLLFGQRVTLTGDFAPFDKGLLWQEIADAGANINKGVTKKTTILVAGPWDSITSKEKRARQLKEQGQEIEIWNEKQLFDVLGLDPNSQ